MINNDAGLRLLLANINRKMFLYSRITRKRLYVMVGTQEQLSHCFGIALWSSIACPNKKFF